MQQLLQALLLLLQQFTLYYCRLEPVVVVPIKDRVLQQCCLEPGGRVQEHERTDKRQPEKVKKENLSLLAKQQRAHTAHRTGHRELHTRTAHRGPPHKPDTLCALAPHARTPRSSPFLVNIIRRYFIVKPSETDITCQNGNTRVVPPYPIVIKYRKT